MSNLNILFETENYFIVDKPAGILVYNPPGIITPETTIADLIKDKINFKTLSERNGIVHRLDRDTSGVLLIAKNEQSQEKLKELFLNRTVQKIYLGLVIGKLEPPKGKISVPLGRSSKDRLRVIPSGQGKESVTEYQVLKYNERSKMSLVELDLKTGRTHQIRVHMAAIGHPVIGDPKYAKKRDDLPRQFLHAQKLSFIDPFDGKKVSVESPLPEELENFLQKHSI